MDSRLYNEAKNALASRRVVYNWRYHPTANWGIHLLETVAVFAKLHVNVVICRSKVRRLASNAVQGGSNVVTCLRNFQERTDGLWVGAVQELESAKEPINELSAHTNSHFLVSDKPTMKLAP